MDAGYLFDPVTVGTRECAALVAYYRRQWGRFAVNSFGMVRGAFGLSRWQALVGSWWVLRANLAWAPPVDNDPNRAEAFMARFYGLVDGHHGLRFDPGRAAQLEVVWWTEHRRAQRAGSIADTVAAESLADVYRHVFRIGHTAARRAAELRVEGFDWSDRWAASARHTGSHLIAQERSCLIASYSELRAALR